MWTEFLSLVDESLAFINCFVGMPAPEIIGDIQKGTLSIKGKSLPEDARSFFTPFNKWLIGFLKTEADSLSVSLELEYYNTVSSKVIHTLMCDLRDLKSTKEIKIEWGFEKDDFEMEEAGLGFQELVGDILVMKPIQIQR